MSVVVQGDGEQVAISEMLFRRCKQKIDKHGTCSAGRRRKDERAQKCHCKLRNAFLGQASKEGTSMILVLQGGGGRKKHSGNAIANSEMLSTT